MPCKQGRGHGHCQLPTVDAEQEATLIELMQRQGWQRYRGRVGKEAQRPLRSSGSKKRRCIQECRARGKCGLYQVPRQSMSGQKYSRFQNFWGPEISVCVWITLLVKIWDSWNTQLRDNFTKCFKAFCQESQVSSCTVFPVYSVMWGSHFRFWMFRSGILRPQQISLRKYGLKSPTLVILGFHVSPKALGTFWCPYYFSSSASCYR